MKQHQNGYFYDLIPNLPVTSYQTTKLYSLDSLKTSQFIQHTQSMHQIHSDIFFQAEQQLSFEPIADSIFTTNFNITLSVKTADCLPIIFFHPYPLIGAIHAGRKGSENHITFKTIHYLKTTFNLDDEFTFWFGPCISKEHYEINQKYLKNSSDGYKILRKYPSLAEQLDYIFHNGITKWKSDMIQPVKDKYPKG